MGILITPLQQLLRDKRRPTREICQATGRSRYAVGRWKRGESYPLPGDARRLIELFEAEGLDFNGCYEASVEVEHG